MFTKRKKNRPHPFQNNTESRFITPKCQEKEIVTESRAKVNFSSLNIFKVIFIFFSLTGIEAFCHSKIADLNGFKVNRSESLKYRLTLIIQNGSKYIVYTGLCTKVLLGIVMILYEDLTKCLTRIFIVLLTLLFYTSVYRKRQAMLQMTINLSQTLKVVADCSPNIKTYSFIAYLIMMQILILIWTTLRYLSEDYMNVIQKITSDSLSHTMYYSNLLLGIIFTIASTVTCIVLSLFSMYYSLTCNFIRVLLKHVLERMEGDFFPGDLENIFLAYGDIARYMRSMDEHFSMPVFFTVFFTMTGLFWGGYRIAFHSGITKMYFLSLIIPLIFYLSIQLMIMVSASSTNELANEVRCVIQCLPYGNPPQDPKRIFKLKKDLNRDNSLTLWKVYVMDRSLVITSIGTLLTYGILIGTLGKST
ncbi:uncharacterized protein TNIN_291981 [Trichonephila inaurata madagascariensis]|uniref:Uncharacterized protein n=1 Tax=Trichonephila inaurata madagascariensis TaxID=2747483 RepID=A0A8X6Y789_9ARAC|nr:uncharacterized protein TNIN_291981 [Trichonephila inaurata madagascariensis]